MSATGKGSWSCLLPWEQLARRVTELGRIDGADVIDTSPIRPRPDFNPHPVPDSMDHDDFEEDVTSFKRLLPAVRALLSARTTAGFDYMHLYEALYQFQHCLYSDDHDGIYGLLGLVYPAERLVADYSLDMEQTWRSALAVIERVNGRPMELEMVDSFRRTFDLEPLAGAKERMEQASEVELDPLEQALIDNMRKKTESRTLLRAQTLKAGVPAVSVL